MRLEMYFQITESLTEDYERCLKNKNIICFNLKYLLICKYWNSEYITWNQSTHSIVMPII